MTEADRTGGGGMPGAGRDGPPAPAGATLPAEAVPSVGVGPWAGPWPDDPRYDPQLLAGGDRRNVVDRYRYWRREAIVADLDHYRHDFHVAIENWQHDLNIGTVVRNANAFLAACIHIVGRRRWNRRGAMVTDRYQHLRHHESIEHFLRWAGEAELPVIGIDNLPGAQLLTTRPLPRRCVLLFGQEGPGLSARARAACDQILFIPQYGSTRSINAGVASGIAMYTWLLQHADARVDRPTGAPAHQPADARTDHPVEGSVQPSGVPRADHPSGVYPTEVPIGAAATDQPGGGGSVPRPGTSGVPSPARASGHEQAIDRWHRWETGGNAEITQ